MPGGVQGARDCCTEGYGSGVLVVGGQLDWVISEVFSSLGGSVVLHHCLSLRSVQPTQRCPRTADPSPDSVQETQPD